MELVEYLKQAVADRASDLFIVAGGVVSEKVEGRLRPIGTERVFPPETEHLISEIYKLANRPMDRYQAAGDDDFSFAVPGLARFRVNAYRQRGSMAAVVRVVSFEIPDWKSMGIPETVMDLADAGHGMVLVTGTAGSGKSTTPGHGAGSAWRADGGAVRPGPPCGCLDPGPSKGRDSVP